MFEKGLIKASAHITGGGLTENIPRVLTKDYTAHLDANHFYIPPVFAWLASAGNITAAEMQRTYNCGLGMILIAEKQNEKTIMEHLKFTYRAACVGTIKKRKSSNAPQVIVDNFEKCLERTKINLKLPRKRIAVIISGSGTNLQALINACQDSSQGLNSEIVLVISNKPDVMGLKRASAAGIPTVVLPHKDFKTRMEFDATMTKYLLEKNVDIVCLAGFMRIVSEEFVKQWKGRLINIHPSLLPKHPGVHVQQKAIDAGDSEAGCTVHFVDEVNIYLNIKIFKFN